MPDPVAIVGGGIGGLTAALALRHHGIECVVYEQAPELHEIGAGLGLWPAALAVFDRLGLGTEVHARSVDRGRSPDCGAPTARTSFATPRRSSRRGWVNRRSGSTAASSRRCCSVTFPTTPFGPTPALRASSTSTLRPACDSEPARSCRPGR